MTKRDPHHTFIQRRLSTLAVLAALCSLAAGGCSRGYASARDLESNRRGPRECAASCGELGLEMGAFVLMDHAHAGCVCTPRASSGGEIAPRAGSGGVAGAAAYLAAAEAARQQQQQAQQQYQ